MTASEALEHPWLNPDSQNQILMKQRSVEIPTSWHRCLYQSYFKEERDDSTCALGRRLALIEADTNLRHISKVKFGKAQTPHLMPMYHVTARESENAKIVCKVNSNSIDGKEKFNW